MLMSAHETPDRNELLAHAESITFGYRAAPVLRDVSFRANHGEMIGLLGPNGSGKSTLLRCLAGLFSVSHGRVMLTGRDVRSMRRKQIAGTVSFLPQMQEPVKQVTVRELVERGRHPHTAYGWHLSKKDHYAVSAAIEYLQLERLRDQPIEQISGGERQRAWIAMVLAQDTPLVLLDEPVTFLDIKHQWSLLGLLCDLKENLGKTIVMVLHDVNHAMAVCDRLYLLAEGRVLAQGTPEAVITSELLNLTYGISAHVCYVKQAGCSVVIPHCSCQMRKQTQIYEATEYVE